MFIYVCDAAGVLDGPVTFPEVPGLGLHLPGNAIELAESLAVTAPGHVWGLVEGKPQLLADYRGMVYHTDTGAEQEHTELGALPQGLTEKPWPGQFYVWAGAGWVLDAAAQIEAAQAGERAWRNVQIAGTDYLVMPDYPITAEQRSDLYGYRQALRDWPDVTLFPDQAGRPQPPAWIAS